MVERQDVWSLLPRPLRQLPADLAAVVVMTLLTLITVLVPGIKETPLRVVFGLAFALFLPGYAFIAALFPETGAAAHADDAAGSTSPSEPDESDTVHDEKPDPVPGTEAAESDGDPSAHRSGDDSVPSEDSPASAPDRSGIDGIERVALSVGISIAIVPLVGLVLNFTPWGIRLTPIVVVVTGFTLLCVTVAAQRRWALPKTERFTVPYRAWASAVRKELFEPTSRTDTAFNIVLALSVLFAVGSAGYVTAVPSQEESFSEFYLLTENTDGELVVDEYPDTMVIGDRTDITVGIKNHEYETADYTVVVQLQDVATEGNTSTVVERTEIDRFSATVEHNETHHEQHTLRPTLAGENTRVKYLLYINEVPENPTQDNSYRDLHLWIDVR